MTRAARLVGATGQQTAGPAGLVQTAPLVDTHAHVFGEQMPVSDTAWHHPPAPAPVEAYLDVLDRFGVHFGVIAAASIFGDYNDYAIEAIRAHRRLKATVIVSPDIDPYALKEMDRDGVVGIRLQFRNVDTPPDLGSFAYQRLFRRIADLGWHVHLHDEGARLPNFIEKIEDAGPRLVIDHFGRPCPDAGTESPGFRAVLAAVQRGRTWVKLSAAFRIREGLTSATLTEKLLSEAGTGRLLWGSDWPFASFEDRMSYDTVLRTYFDDVPDPRTRDEIDRTALKFYFS